MTRETVAIHVGQCGNQMARPFWRNVVEEFAASYRNRGKKSDTKSYPTYDDSMATMLRNVDGRNQMDMPIGTPLLHLRARAVLIDMEPGVVDETLRTPLSSLFSQDCTFTDSSGAGNNFAHGFMYYGSKHEEAIYDIIRKQVEHCDNPAKFLLFHSCGGGTGSGVGCKTLSILQDNFSNIARHAVTILPSTSREKYSDDVIVSPYNAVLSLSELCIHANAIFPMSNKQLAAQSTNFSLSNHKSSTTWIRKESKGLKDKASARDGFLDLNTIASRALLDTTVGERFPKGKENDIISELTRSDKRFLTIGYRFTANRDFLPKQKVTARLIGELTRATFRKQNTLTECQYDQMRYNIESCHTIYRFPDRLPAELVSDVKGLRHSFKSLSEKLQISQYPRKKLALSDVHSSLVSIINSSSINDSFLSLSRSYSKLFGRKAMLHHYTEYCDEALFTDAMENLSRVISAYNSCKQATLAEDKA